MSSYQSVTLTVRVIDISDGSMVIKFRGREVRIPCSQILKEEYLDGGRTRLRIPEWIAIDRGIMPRFHRGCKR